MAWIGMIFWFVCAAVVFVAARQSHADGRLWETRLESVGIGWVILAAMILSPVLLPFLWVGGLVAWLISIKNQ